MIAGDCLNIQFDIIKQHGSYIVRRVDGEYKQHAHISSMSGCKTLISLIRQDKLPTSKYLQGSCRRLLTDDEYARLKPKRQRHININKGVR